MAEDTCDYCGAQKPALLDSKEGRGKQICYECKELNKDEYNLNTE